MSNTNQSDETTSDSSSQNGSTNRSDETRFFHQWPITLGDHIVTTDVALKVVGLCWFGTIGLLFNGIVGLGVAVVVAVIVGSYPVVAVGIAHAGLLLLYPDFTGIAVSTAGELLLYEGSLTVLLLSNPPYERISILFTIGFALVLGITLFAVLSLSGEFAAIIILLFIIFVVGYLLHRYERVSLGLAVTDVDTMDANQ